MDLKEKLLCAIKSNVLDLKLSGDDLYLYKNNNYIWIVKNAIKEHNSIEVKSGFFGRTKKVTTSKITGYTYEIFYLSYKYSITEEEFNNILSLRKEAQYNQIEKDLDKLCKVK